MSSGQGFKRCLVVLALLLFAHDRATAQDDAGVQELPPHDGGTEADDRGAVADDRGAEAHDGATEDPQDALGFGAHETDQDTDALGFSDAPESVAPPVAPPPPEAGTRLHIAGFARSQFGMWTDRVDTNPFAKARQNLDLSLRYQDELVRFIATGHAEYDLAYRYKRDDYDQATLDAYESLVDLRETLLAVRFKHVEVSVGRQFLILGKGDLLSPLDVATAKDRREPGLLDLDDVRLPLLSTRLEWFAGYHRVELVFIHEGFYGYRTAPYGPFSPLPYLLRAEDTTDLNVLFVDSNVDFSERQRGVSAQTQQGFANWSYTGPGIDTGLFAGVLRDQVGVLTGLDPPLSFADRTVPTEVRLVLEHPRYALIGSYGAAPVGDFVFKWEASFDYDRPYNRGSVLASRINPQVARDNFVTAMVGATYAGIPDVRLYLEGAKSTLFAAEGTHVLMRIDEPIYAARAEYTPWQDWAFELTFSGVGWRLEYGWLMRAEARYALGHGLGLSLKALRYYPTDRFGPLSGLQDRDRLDFALRWDFTAH